MALSERVNHLFPSMTLVITDKARKLKAEGVDVISFSAGEPDFPTPEPIKQEGIKWIERDFTKYSESNGIPELKEAICKKLWEENGLSYQPSQILVGNGAKQLIFEACGILIDPGDEVIIPTPGWVSYVEQVVFFGGVPVLPAADEKNNFRLTAVREWAALTDQVRDALASHQYDLLPALFDRNFDLRCEVCGSSVSQKNRRMVQIGRQFGASAKFTGSGGAIIGTYRADTFDDMRRELKKYDVEVIKPEIVR